MLGQRKPCDFSAQPTIHPTEAGQRYGVVHQRSHYMNNDPFFDHKFVHESYQTQDDLAIRILSHQRYSLQTENIFDAMTRHALTITHPQRILDIGAGTGAWYQRIRRYAGDHCFYLAIDQSRAMVKQLEDNLLHDTQALVRRGSAENLNDELGSFDWIGLHFMLYHVADIRDVLSRALKLLRPSGLLLCATNGSNSYEEMMARHQQAARTLGLPYQPSHGIDRFSLKSGSRFFPVPVHKVEVPAGLLFPSIDSYLSYYGSGFCWQGIPRDSHTPEIKEQLIKTMAELVRPHFEERGALKLSNTSGYFWTQK